MAVLNAIPKDERAERRKEIIQSEGLAWLRRQGAAAGFDFDDGGIAVDGYEPLTIRGNAQECAEAERHRIRRDADVREPEIFLAKLARGFGRGKAFGLGLMLVRRPPRMSGAALPGLPPPRPIPLKDRSSIIFIEKGNVDVLDGAFVVVDKNGIRTHIPIGGLACLMLEPGARISHAAVALASRAGTLIIWVGEAGVRLYAAGQPGGARSDRLLYQARLALDDDARLKVVRKMYAMRFGEDAPERRSVDQLRGIEGVRVRKLYRAASPGAMASNGKDAITTRGISARRIFPTAASALQPPASTASRRPPCLLPAMRPRSAFCTRASRSRSSTTLRISSSSRPSCPRRFALRGVRRLAGRLKERSRRCGPPRVPRRFPQDRRFWSG